MSNQVRYPPADAPDDPPAAATRDVRTCWRIHREPRPLRPKRYPAGRWRFDAPDGSWPVTYVNKTQMGAFAEVFAGQSEIGPGDASRRLSYVNSNATLTVIPLEDPGTLAKFGLDSAISTTSAYGRTMLWGARLREWYPDADGISYLGRRGGSHQNYCFWLDRCSAKLNFTTVGMLKRLESEVLLACDYLKLAPRIFDPDATTGWP